MLVGKRAWSLALDKAEYAPGEKATLTLTLKDKNGVALPDQAAADLLDDALTSSTALTSSLFGSATAGVSSVTLVNGVATVSFYAPLVAGPFTVAGKTLASASADATSIALSASAKVVAPVDATVTAINAKVASTEATVAALQVTVASVIKSLKVQWWLLKKIAVKVGIKLG